MEEVIEGVRVFFITRNTRITEYLKDYFTERISKIISKIPESIRESTSIYFIHKREGDEKSIEIIVTMKKGKFPPIYTTEEGDDPRAVIDKAVYEIERQLDKQKTEFENIIRDAMRTKREIHPMQEPEEAEEESADIQIDRTRVKIEKPISLDDAIAILEDMEKRRIGRRLPIYIFSDFDGTVKVLYKQGEKKYIVFEIT